MTKQRLRKSNFTKPELPKVKLIDQTRTAKVQDHMIRATKAEGEQAET